MTDFSRPAPEQTNAEAQPSPAHGSVSQRPKRMFGCIGISAIGLLFLALAASLSVPKFRRVSERGEVGTQASEATLISQHLEFYAARHHGTYPDTLDELVKKETSIHLAHFLKRAEQRLPGKGHRLYQRSPKETEKWVLISPGPT